MSALDCIKNLLPKSVFKALLQSYRAITGRCRVSHTELVEYNGGLYLASKGSFTDEVLLKTGGYESNLQRIMKSVIHDSWTVIDIGANTGIHTVVMASQAVNGHAYAFEPVDYNFRTLNANVVLSGLKNISIFNCAIGEKNGSLDLKVILPTRSEQGSSSLVLNEHLATLGSDAYHETQTNVVSLDAFVSDHGIEKVDFIKMDIEGYEYWALLGMAETIAAHRPVLIIEYNVTRLEHLGLSNGDMQKILERHYDCYEISKFDYVAEYALDPFLFDRHLESDLLCIPKPKN